MFFKPLLLPLLAQVLLTFLVWAYMYYTRLKETSGSRIHPQKLSTRSQARSLLTSSAAQADNLQNLFEMPVLFYTAILLSLILMLQDAVLVQLAWAYVILRVVHSLIHCSYNRVIHRFAAYLASCLVLLLMWARLAQYILTH
jgi:hypothetical protein